MNSTPNNFQPDLGQIPFFPESLERVGKELDLLVGSDPALSRAAMIAAMGVTYQNHAYVERANRQDTFLNVYVCSVAESGTGKSPVQSLALRSQTELDQRLVLEAADAQSDYQAELITWTEVKNVYASEIRRCIESDESPDGIAQLLKIHMKKKPVDPGTGGFILTDATEQAAKSFLARQSSALWKGTEMDSAAKLLKGILLNQLWHPNKQRVDRVSTGSVVLDNVFLSVFTQSQPEPFHQQLANSRHLALENGTLARFFFHEVPAGLPKRPRRPDNACNFTELDIFHAKMAAVLAETFPSPGCTRSPMKKLRLSDDALYLEQRFEDHLRGKSLPGGPFHYVQECVRKAPTNVCKLAAHFHLYDGLDGPISGATYNTAAGIGEWFVQQQATAFARYAPIPPEVSDRQELLNFLGRYAFNMQSGFIPKGQLLSYGPSCLRKAHRLDSTLARLTAEGIVSVHRFRKAAWVMLNPNFFSGIPPIATLPPYLVQPPIWVPKPPDL